jgi:hypothetical protein
MSGNSCEQIARKRRNGQFGFLGAELIVEPVDQLDELLVLTIDRFDADTLFVLPLQQHGSHPDLDSAVPVRSYAIWKNFSRSFGCPLL